EKLFKRKEYFKLLLYSNIINNQKMSIDSSLSNNPKYIDAINNVYIEMSEDFKEYKYSHGITNKIVDNFDFSKINYNENNFWKIDMLIPSLKQYAKSISLFNRLNDCNILNDYISHCRNNGIDDNYFLEN